MIATQDADIYLIKNVLYVNESKPVQLHNLRVRSVKKTAFSLRVFVSRSPDCINLNTRCCSLPFVAVLYYKQDVFSSEISVSAVDVRDFGSVFCCQYNFRTYCTWKQY